MILGILQARTSSTRLPSKVLLPLAGAPMLQRQIERIMRARRIEKLVVATSDDPADQAVVDIAEVSGVAVFQGSLKDVLDRFYRAAEPSKPDWIVRLTGDCPLTDGQLIDQCVDFALAGDFDYASNALRPTYPDGLDVEVFRFTALEAAWREARSPIEREHVTPFIYRRPEFFRIGSLESNVDRSRFRWTVDEPADYAFVRAIYDALFLAKPEFTSEDVLELLNRRPQLAALNQGIRRNEGMQFSEGRSA